MTILVDRQPADRDEFYGRIILDIEKTGAGTITGIFLILIWTIGCLLYFRAKKASEQIMVARSQALDRLTEAVEADLHVLQRRKKILIVFDPYGIQDSSAWDKELARYVEKKLLLHPASASFSSALSNHDMVGAIEDLISSDGQGENSLVSTVFASAADFEIKCASVFERCGWRSSTTKGSGDQGADVVATKKSRTAVLQCKFYTRPVGNKAVQEIVAAKKFYGADFAAVVCKTSFTKSAHQLANANNVALLHYDELEEYAVRLKT